MKRRFAAIALGALFAAPVQAFDLTTMSDAERAAFGAEVRAYIMQNPEVIMEAIGVLEEREAEMKEQLDVALVENNADALFNDPTSWVGGNPDGDITMVEFLDYRCGYCRKAHVDVANLLKQDGNIRIIVKEFPILGEASMVSSQFAVAVRLVAGDDAYKAAGEALIKLNGGVGEPVLRRLAGTLGLDADAVIDKMQSDEVSQIINTNHLLGQRMQINGTPTFVVKDQMLRGYLPLDAMKQVVAQVRDKG